MRATILLACLAAGCAAPEAIQPPHLESVSRCDMVRSEQQTYRACADGVRDSNEIQMENWERVRAAALAPVDTDLPTLHLQPFPTDVPRPSGPAYVAPPTSGPAIEYYGPEPLPAPQFVPAMPGAATGAGGYNPIMH